MKAKLCFESPHFVFRSCDFKWLIHESAIFKNLLSFIIIT